MPEPTPTTDTKGKKPNKTVIILGGAGIAILFYFIWKHKQNERESQVPYTSQSFIPVTGENVAGAGASAPFGGSGLGGGVSSGESGTIISQAQKENNEIITRFLQQEQESRREENRERLQFEKERIPPGTIANITGGGAPSSGQVNSGAGSGGGGSGATTTSKPSSPVASFKTIKCPNGCTGHEYPHGHSGHGSREVECQQGEARRGNCHW